MSRRNKDAPKGRQAVNDMAVNDAFSNPMFRLGYQSQSPLEATQYPLTRMTDDYALLNSLYRDNWVVQNVISIIPDDMLRPWFTVSGLGPEEQKALEKTERSAQLRQRLGDGLKWGRLYGGAGALIMIRGQEERLEEPLDLESILPGTFAGLYVFDRWCGITPMMKLVTDMSDPDFGLPEYYQITNDEIGLTQKIHHSRILRFEGRELPYLEKLAELYWGESEVEAIYQDIVKHDNVSYNMASLTFQANINTMEVENLDQLFSVTSIAQQKRFWSVMQAQSVAQSNFGMRLVNKGDSVKNTQYTFSGLKDVYESMCLDLSGASGIPVTKLFGRSPAGMNATGESDLQNYYDRIDSNRESKLRPILERLLPVMCMSTFGVIPDGADIVFPALWTPTAREVADIAKAKSETVIAAVQAGLLTIGMGQEELKKLEDETGMFGTIPDEQIEANQGLSFRDATSLRDPMMGLEWGEEE